MSQLGIIDLPAREKKNSKRKNIPNQDSQPTVKPNTENTPKYQIFETANDFIIHSLKQKGIDLHPSQNDTKQDSPPPHSKQNIHTQSDIKEDTKSNTNEINKPVVIKQDQWRKKKKITEANQTNKSRNMHQYIQNQQTNPNAKNSGKKRIKKLKRLNIINPLSQKITNNGYKLKLDDELNGLQILKKLMNGWLNRMTSQKFYKVYENIMVIILDLVDNKEALNEILSLIVNHALDKEIFIEQYIDLCKLLRAKILPKLLQKSVFIIINYNENKKQMTIKELINFYRKSLIILLEKKFHENRNKLREYTDEYIVNDNDYKKYKKIKNCFFNLIIFMGIGYNKKVLHANIIWKSILKQLIVWNNEPISEVEIVGICKLLNVSGKYLDKDDKTHKWLTKYIDDMKKQSENMGFRIQFMLEHVQKNKDTKWLGK
eukprot:391520_1